MKAGVIRGINLGELIRFGVVGGASFAIDFGFLIVFQEFVFAAVSHGVMISQALSFTISLVIHYFLASMWVFRDHSVTDAKTHTIAGTLFVVTNVVGLGINEFFLFVGVSKLSLHYVPVKLFATGVAMVWNYLCQKLVIFRRGN